MCLVPWDVLVANIVVHKPIDIIIKVDFVIMVSYLMEYEHIAVKWSLYVKTLSRTLHDLSRVIYRSSALLYLSSIDL